METYLSAYLACLALLVVVTAGIGIRAFVNWQSPGARTLGFLMISMTVWAGFYLLEVMHPALPVKVVARKLLYLGMSLSPPLWLGFALRYTRLDSWWSKSGRVFLLAIPGSLAFLLGITNESHHLIWQSLSISNHQPAPLGIEYGHGFWGFTAIAYAMIAAGFTVYIVAYFQSDKALRVKTGVVLAGGFLTAAVNVAFLFVENDLRLDPTPLSFALTAPLIAFGYFRFGVLGLFPLAASLVVEHLQDAIIIVNREDEITDINHAAMKLLGLKGVHEGMSFFFSLPNPELFRRVWNDPHAVETLGLKSGADDRTYNVRVIPMRTNASKLIGRVVVFHDITREQALLRAEKRRSQQLILLEEAGRHIADSFDEREILQRAVDAITRQFGHAETSISIQTPSGELEVAAISGSADFGYRPGFRQAVGAGIIGHTAALQKTYVAPNVSIDPYYFSTSAGSGSAICTPIFKQSALYGVLYVESFDLNAFDELDVLMLETLASQVSESLQRAALHARTQNDLLTLTTIQDISKLIASSLDLETISATVVKSLKEAFGYTHASIYFLDEEYLRLTAQIGYPKEMIINKIHISQGVIGRAVRTRVVQFIEETEKEDIFLKADLVITSEICVPLLKEDAVLGVLNVESNERGRLTPADADLLTAVAGPIAVAVDNARLHAELKKMATTDAVTGLSNRHVFEQALHAEVERAQRNASLLSLIVFDIDFFKQYNDQNGHPAGDERLKAVAAIIKLNLRKYDIAARYGGDEFAIILTSCSPQSALRFAQRLCQETLAGAPNADDLAMGTPGYTLSLGIATYPQDAVLPSELLIAADHAAMRAKQEGRNRIKFASDYETS